MTDLTASTSDLTAKNSTLASQFLASLSGRITSGSSLNGLFDHMLADFHLQQPASSTRSTVSEKPVAQTSNSDTAATAKALSLSSRVNGEHPNVAAHTLSHKNSNLTLNDKAQGQKDSSQHDDAANTAAAASLDASAPVTQTVTPTTVSTNPNATSSSDTQNTISNAANAADDSQQPSLSDLATQLQAMLQFVRQNGADSSSTGNQAVASSPGSTDPSLQTLDQALAELTKLAQAAGQGASITQDASSATASNQNLFGSIAPAAAEIQQAPTDAQLLANLKSMFEGLKNGAAANKNVASADIQNAPKTFDSAAAAITPMTSVASTSTPDPVVKTGLQGNDMLQQFNNLFAATANTSSVVQPVTPVQSFAPVIEAQLAANSIKSVSPTSSDTNTDSGFNAYANTTSELTVPTNAAAGLEGLKTTNSYSFASQLANAQSGSTTASGLPTAVEQVMFQLSRNIKSGNDQMTLQLQPAELGRINIKLKFANDGSVQGTVVADNAATLDMLQKDSRNLERTLQDAGLSADPGSLQFSLSGQGQGNSNQMANNFSGSQTAYAGQTTNASSMPAAETADTWVMTPGRVNMKV